MQVPKRKSEQHRKFAGLDDHYLSPAAIAKLKQELERLRDYSHPKAIADLQSAQAMGDLSENAAYSEAKGRLMGINRRMLEVAELLKNAVVVHSGVADDGSIRIGATVTVEVNGKERVFEITGARETDPASGKISHLSPIGSALLRHKAGDSVTVHVNGRDVIYLVKDVR